MARKQIFYSPGQIQSGLYTNGREWMLEDGTEWIGAYHKYSTGEVYTDSNYVDGVSKPLIEYIDTSEIDKYRKFTYDNLIESKVDDFFSPPYYKASPTQDDYNNGYVDRYIVKRIGRDIFSETKRADFAKVQPQHYLKLKVRWKLIGDAIIVNQRTIRNAEKDIKGISNYITNYSEFVKV